MNSDLIANNFANSDETKYSSHFITLVSGKVSYENNVGKFVINYANPNAPGSAFDKTLPRKSIGNIVNKKDGIGVSRITSSNYTTIAVPKHLFYITDIKLINTSPDKIIDEDGKERCNCNYELEYKRKEYLRGQRFLVINAGGSVDKPCIVGVI